MNSIHRLTHRVFARAAMATLFVAGGLAALVAAHLNQVETTVIWLDQWSVTIG